MLTFPSLFLKYDFIFPSQLFPRHHVTSGCCICHLSLRFLVTGSWTCFLLDNLGSFKVCWPGTLWSVFIMKFIVIIIIFIIMLDLLGSGIEVLFLSQYVKYTNSMIYDCPHDFDNCTKQTVTRHAHCKVAFLFPVLHALERSSYEQLIFRWGVMFLFL